MHEVVGPVDQVKDEEASGEEDAAQAVQGAGVGDVRLGAGGCRRLLFLRLRLCGIRSGQQSGYLEHGLGMFDDLLVGEPVDQRELQQRSKYHDHTSTDPHIDGLDIGHRRQGCPDARGEGGEGEQSGDAEGHSPGHGVRVQPEGHPRDGHDEDGGHVGLQDVVAVLATQVEVDQQTAEVTCSEDLGCILASVVQKVKLGDLQLIRQVDGTVARPLVVNDLLRVGVGTNGDPTNLEVQGIFPELHVARKPQRGPDAIQNISVVFYPQQNVGHRDGVKLRVLHVVEESVRLPDFALQLIARNSNLVLLVDGVDEPRVVPSLPQEYVNRVIVLRQREATRLRRTDCRGSGAALRLEPTRTL